MQLFRGVFLLLATMALLATTAGAQLVMVSSEPLVLHDGAGSARLLLRNDGAVRLPLTLSAGPFIDQTSRLTLPAAKAGFAVEGSAQTYLYIDPGQQQAVLATVSGLTGTTTAEARLFNGSGSSLAAVRMVNAKDEPGLLSAVAVDLPLKLTLEGEGSAEKPLQFYYKRPFELLVKNTSKDSLTLDWTLEIAGTQLASDRIVMTPNESERLKIEPPKDPKNEIFTWKDWVRPTHRQGRLTVRLHTPKGVAETLAPAVTLPIEVTTLRHSQEAMEILFALWVMAFLLVGGLISLLGSAMLPNILKKIGLRRQIGELADRTSSVSTRVDSYLRVLLRLERSKINAALKAVGPLSLSSTERFEDVSDAIARLEKRLAIVERLDALCRNFEEVSNWAPPSLSAAISAILHTAARQMHSFALPEEDVSAAGRLLDKAEALLAEANNPDAQSARIVENFKELTTRAKTFPDAYYKDFKDALPGIFQILGTPEEEVNSIVPTMFFAIDHAIAAVHTAFDYAMVRSSVAVDTDIIEGVAGKEIRERQAARECELIELLGTLSWRALRAATLLVRQMRENIFDADVLAEMGKRRPDGERRVRVAFDAQKVRPYVPVNFTIAFDDPRFKDAAALDALSFRWSFPDGHAEEGVKVCHYFTGEEAKLHHSGKIKIVLAVQSQRTLTAATTLEGTIAVNERRVHQATQAVAEFVRFLFAFGVALAGLEAGAMDRLGKLDLLPATIAVIALGFGADSIKNLLTQSSAKKTA